MLVRRLVLLVAAGSVLIGACSSDDDDPPSAAAVTTTTSTTAAPSGEPGGTTTSIRSDAGALCPTDADVARVFGYPMVVEERRQDGCRWGHHDRADGRLDVTFSMSWVPVTSGVTVSNTGSSTSTANDSGHHRTARTLDTTTWRWSLEIVYDWADRDAPSWEHGRDQLDRYLDILETMD